MSFLKPRPFVRVFKNDRVRLRDGRIVEVTDASSDDSDTLYWIDRREWLDNGREVVTATMPNETIFMGYDVETKATVISDMCEVKMVIDKSLLV
jgi:hypothetical protein